MEWHAIHVIAANALGRSPLMLALEGGGGVDGAAVAMELINISGAFASGELDATQLILDTQTASETLHSTSVPAFERLRAKNNKT